MASWKRDNLIWLIDLFSSQYEYSILIPIYLNEQINWDQNPIWLILTNHSNNLLGSSFCDFIDPRAVTVDTFMSLRSPSGLIIQISNEKSRRWIWAKLRGTMRKWGCFIPPPFQAKVRIPTAEARDHNCLWGRQLNLSQNLWLALE